MGYQTTNNQYIIENDVEENNKTAFKKEMKTAAQINNGLPDGYEMEPEPVNPTKSIQEELLEEATKEGLVSDSEYLGGKGASPQEVIDAMRQEGMSTGAQEKKEQYEEQKFNEFKTITATRDLLFNRVKKTIPVTVAMVIDGEPYNVEFKVKRLTEAENTHILNHKLIGKEIREMTDEEYMQSSQFRSKVLEKAVVEPKMTSEEWQHCSNGDITSIYEQVNKVLTEADDVSVFQ